MALRGPSATPMTVGCNEGLGITPAAARYGHPSDPKHKEQCSRWFRHYRHKNVIDDYVAGLNVDREADRVEIVPSELNFLRRLVKVQYL